VDDRASVRMRLARDSMKHWTTKLRESIIENPFAWILAGLFLFAEYSNYKKGMDIQRVCELTGPHDVASNHPRNDKEELDSICINRASDE
jgi:hypothetical protein